MFHVSSKRDSSAAQQAAALHLLGHFRVWYVKSSEKLVWNDVKQHVKLQKEEITAFYIRTSPRGCLKHPRCYFIFLLPNAYGSPRDLPSFSRCLVCCLTFSYFPPAVLSIFSLVFLLSECSLMREVFSVKINPVTPAYPYRQLWFSFFGTELYLLKRAYELLNFKTRWGGDQWVKPLQVYVHFRILPLAKFSLRAALWRWLTTRSICRSEIRAYWSAWVKCACVFKCSAIDLALAGRWMDRFSGKTFFNVEKPSCLQTMKRFVVTNGKYFSCWRLHHLFSFSMTCFAHYAAGSKPKAL